MSRQLAYLWGGVVLLLIATSPWASVVADALWPCAFKSLTGFACPSCGATRAALALASLEVLDALTHYPLATLGWIAFTGGGLAALSMTLAGRTPPPIPNRLPAWARLVLCAVLISNWVYSIATGV